MTQTMMILATVLLASSLISAAAEARGGSNAGGFGQRNVQFGSGRAYFEGVEPNSMRRFDSSYPAFDRDYDPSCDNDWMPKQMWASSCS